MASNKIGTVLSENYLSYVFWPICLILGIPINSYCLYHLIKKTKLNGYIKAIMVKNMITRGCIFLLSIEEGKELRIQYCQQESKKYENNRKNTNSASMQLGPLGGHNLLCLKSYNIQDGEFKLKCLQTCS